jgi:phage terminase large subunit-like protein
MNFYCYNQNVELGKEKLGSDGKAIIRDLKTLKGVVNRLEKYGWKEYRIYSFTNFYDDKTFQLLKTKINTEGFEISMDGVKRP